LIRLQCEGWVTRLSHLGCKPSLDFDPVMTSHIIKFTTPKGETETIEIFIFGPENGMPTEANVVQHSRKVAFYVDLEGRLKWDMYAIQSGVMECFRQAGVRRFGSLSEN
jgi:hypothetical protein